MLVDLKPTGEGYMEDFHAPGGLPALLWELRDLLHHDCIDVTGTRRWATGWHSPPLWTAAISVPAGAR